MQTVADRSEAPTAIRNDLARFSSSGTQSIDMAHVAVASRRDSKHVVRGGDVAGLLERFANFGRKRGRGRGRSSRSSSFRRLAFDGFWIIARCRMKRSKATSSIRPRLRRTRRRQRAKTAGSTVRRWFARYWRTSGANRGCARMVKARTPKEEDRRRLCRERKVLIAERVRHVNREGVPQEIWLRAAAPRPAERLDTLQTGDGRLLPDHLKAQVRRELDRLELLLDQIKAVEAERDVLLAAQQAPAPAAMLLDIKGIGPVRRHPLVGRALPTFDNRRQVASYAGPGANTLAERIGRSRTGRV